MHLFHHLVLRPQHIVQVVGTLRKTKYLSRFINHLDILPGQRSAFMRLSPLFLPYDAPNLKSVNICHLDLNREDVFLSRALLSRSVRQLDLRSLQKCSALQLIRFIKSFHSLSSLAVMFDFMYLKTDGWHALPEPFSSSIARHSLTSLNLHIIPGVSMVIGWCRRAGLFFKNIERLTLNFNGIPLFQDIRHLLDCCRATVVDLTLLFQELLYIPTMEALCKLIELTLLWV